MAYSDVSVAFEIRALEKMTNNFSDEKLVGSGGYGAVYKGVREDGKEIAVKKLHQLIGLDDKPFNNEFHTLININHPNVVQLIGYCYESRRNYKKHNNETITAMVKERILCFEYMHGGSLDKHIGADMCDLDWPICYNIIRRTSDGLNHLHNEQKSPIFHLDLKPSNILLDRNLTPKIADLGLSRIVANTKTHYTESAKEGTLGYMPPEYIKGSAISKKFDVFSLGAIIIRIVDGNKCDLRYSSMDAQQFIKQVREKWERRLQGRSSYQSHDKDIVQVNKCLEIALRCVDDDRTKRPAIKDIVSELEELEAEIKKMSPHSDKSKDPIGQCGGGSSEVRNPSWSREEEAYFRYLTTYRQEVVEHDAKRTLLDDYRAQKMENMYLAMENGTRAPPMGPPPPNPGPAPVMLTIEEFLARGGGGTSGSGHGSNIGGTPGDGTPASRSPITPLHNPGGNAGGASTSSHGSPLF